MYIVQIIQNTFLDDTIQLTCDTRVRRVINRMDPFYYFNNY